MYSEWLIVLLCAYMAFICGCMAYYGGVYRGLCGHGLRDRHSGVALGIGVCGRLCVRCVSVRV